ncbi:hypothetical protein AGOR_G00126530 [Albula goreensis]|uniref:Uncharacterized protein n=1 Tax=Albula goreensis TaxID=1534307 RepID=A0A8T3DD68_9TELE|nr:hypothetical protein AGOR_G00126530 [Albula goreensis]
MIRHRDLWGLARFSAPPKLFCFPPSESCATSAGLDQQEPNFITSFLGEIYGKLKASQSRGIIIIPDLLEGNGRVYGVNIVVALYDPGI